MAGADPTLDMTLKIGIMANCTGWDVAGKGSPDKSLRNSQVLHVGLPKGLARRSSLELQGKGCLYSGDAKCRINGPPGLACFPC